MKLAQVFNTGDMSEVSTGSLGWIRERFFRFRLCMDCVTSDNAAGCSVVVLVAWSSSCRGILALVTVGVIFFFIMDIMHNQRSDVVEEVYGKLMTRMFCGLWITLYVQVSIPTRSVHRNMMLPRSFSRDMWLQASRMCLTSMLCSSPTWQASS